MNAEELLLDAEKRIKETRTADLCIAFADEKGAPIPSVSARIKLIRHEFKLGANAFGLGEEKDALREAYEERFAALLNYGTLPFYWGFYEPEKGKKKQEKLSEMADWCIANDVIPKGHPLAWHEVYPKWAESIADSKVIDMLKKRVKEIVAHFEGRIDIWDVVNEATVSHKVENAVGRWVKNNGGAVCVAEALAWAHRANPDAVLLYNDFNVSPEFERLVEGLLERRAPVHTIGIQSHMHKGVWPVERIWEVCETYAWFGLPLHFTEATVVSGRLKAADDNDWHKVQTDWVTTAEGEAFQLDYGSKFYTMLFSHPAVEAITWWDFSDKWAWQGAPSGLIRKDMTPKPLYDWLVDAFLKRWTTDTKVTADKDGRTTTRCFFGQYEVEAETPSGEKLKGSFAFRRHKNRLAIVTLK
jgi:GH35 family endo-1,4-beta-xylanase